MVSAKRFSDDMSNAKKTSLFILTPVIASIYDVKRTLSTNQMYQVSEKDRIAVVSRFKPHKRVRHFCLMRPCLKVSLLLENEFSLIGEVACFHVI